MEEGGVLFETHFSEENAWPAVDLDHRDKDKRGNNALGFRRDFFGKPAP